MITLKICCFGKFQEHNTVLLTVVSELCIWSPELTHLATESLCLGPKHCLLLRCIVILPSCQTRIYKYYNLYVAVLQSSITKLSEKRLNCIFNWEILGQFNAWSRSECCHTTSAASPAVWPRGGLVHSQQEQPSRRPGRRPQRFRVWSHISHMSLDKWIKLPESELLFIFLNEYFGARNIHLFLQIFITALLCSRDSAFCSRYNIVQGSVPASWDTLYSRRERETGSYEAVK